MKTSTLIILAVVCIVLFIAPLIMFNGHGEDEPPSGEIESLLFALQAAIGAIIIGYAFGYWRGQSKEE